MLIKGLGNKEHSGRTRGVSAYAPWKTGRNWTLEDKRAAKRAKKELYEKNLKESIIADILAQLRAGGDVTLVPSPQTRRSSCASQVTPDDPDDMDIDVCPVHNADDMDMTPPCDDITVNPVIVKLCIYIWHPTS